MRMSAGRRSQFPGEHIGADECDTRALTGHGRRAVGGVYDQDDSTVRPPWHVDLCRRIEVPIGRHWHHLQQPRNLPADSLIDRPERLLLLNPVSQINPKGWGHKAKTSLGLGITARTPDGGN